MYIVIDTEDGPKNPERCSLSAVEMETPDDSGSYVALSPEETSIIIWRLQDEQFPTEFDWVQTGTAYFENPAEKFDRNPRQPFVVTPTVSVPEE